MKFEELFSHQIQQLMYNLPLDKYTPEGTLFWSGAKKPPSPLQFDPEDVTHVEFVRSAAYMRAVIYGLNVPVNALDDSRYRQVAASVTIPPFTPRDGVKVATTDEEAKNNDQSAAFGVDVDAQCDQIIRSLPSPANIQGFPIQAIDFDKDVDFHMKVVASCSNLRARNYKIAEVDLHTSRGIAGKIIPAIATTTALVTGAICVELYKIVQDKPVDDSFNSFFNLAIPLFTSMNPEPPKVTKSVIKGQDFSWTPVRVHYFHVSNG